MWAVLYVVQVRTKSATVNVRIRTKDNGITEEASAAVLHWLKVATAQFRRKQREVHGVDFRTVNWLHT